MVGDLLSAAVYDIVDLVGDAELKILRLDGEGTWAENSSPMKRPSLILIAPIIISVFASIAVCLLFVIFLA